MTMPEWLREHVRMRSHLDSHPLIAYCRKGDHFWRVPDAVCTMHDRAEPACRVANCPDHRGFPDRSNA